MKRLIVGLGNPGEKYKFNRHNTGFILIDELVQHLHLSFTEESKFNSYIAVNNDDLYVKPLEFMNNSGHPVSLISNFYKIVPENIFVIHDDVDLPLGDLKKQFGAGPAGHHGVESIITELGTKDFYRFRVGVGKGTELGIKTEDWVLSNFDSASIEKIKNLASLVSF